MAVAVGIAGRVWGVQDDHGLVFDERQFVPAARLYLGSGPDVNDHPPLGKLFLAVSMAVFGDGPLGWRLPSVLSGLANIGLAGVLARMLFRDPLAGALAAALVALDGTFIVYSRVGLLDGVLVTLFLATAVACVRADRGWHVGVAATLAGLAVSVKFSGGVLLFVVAATCVVKQERLPRWAPLSLGLVPLVYALQYSLGLALSGQPWGPGNVLVWTKLLVRSHLGQHEGTNPWISPWYGWLVPTRPITLCRKLVGEDAIHVMTTLPNLATLWGAEAWALGSALRMLSRRRLDDEAMAVVLVLALAPLLPWIFTARDAYHYHFLPTWAFLVVGAGGGLARLLRTRPALGAVALAAVAAVFAVYAPLWADLTVPLQRALGLPMWR